MRELYLEIVDFLHSCGGPYVTFEREDFDNLIDALFSGRYYLRRNAAREIVTFCNYWKVRLEDLETVRAGGRPDDVNTGEILFVVDCANKDDSVFQLTFVRELWRQCPWIQGVAWFHKRKRPDRFRYYPRQRGGRDG